MNEPEIIKLGEDTQVSEEEWKRLEVILLSHCVSFICGLPEHEDFLVSETEVIGETSQPMPLAQPGPE